MEWFFISLLASFLYSLVNISDQYLVTKYTDSKKASGALVIFSSLVGIIIALGIFLFSFFPYFIELNVFDVSFLDRTLLFITGILTVFWIILYLFALNNDEVSGIVPWFLTIPVFSFIFGYIFLGETLTYLQQVGSLIILFGLVVLSFDFSNKNYVFKYKTGIYMLPACILIAIIGVIFKYVTSVSDFWVSSFWVYLGLGFSGLFIFLFIKDYRLSFLKMLKDGGKKIFTLNIGSEFVSIIGNFLTNYASLLAPITVVYLVGSFQPAILLILTLFCSRFLPNIIKENMDKKVLFPKILAITIMVFGSVLLFLN